MVEEKPKEYSDDPRFAHAPISEGEWKALGAAPRFEEACELLGRMQEERVRDGRLAPPVLVQDRPVPFINQYIPVDKQIAKGIRLTAEELAYIQAAPNAISEQFRTTKFLETRRSRNEKIYKDSRVGRERERIREEERNPPERPEQWQPGRSPRGRESEGYER